MKVLKKRVIVPLLVFLAGISVLTGVIYHVRDNQQKQNREKARLNAITYAERMETDIMEDRLPTHWNRLLSVKTVRLISFLPLQKI